MAASFLLLHGIGNHRPPAHWQFWLAARLVERGQQVVYPDLPLPDAPSPVAWEAALHRHLGEMVGDERTVICHSLACLLWLAAAGRVSEAARPDRLLLVSPPESACVPEEGAEFRLPGFDPAAVRRSVRGELRIVCSDADPYNPPGAQATYGTALGVEAEVVPGAGHITPDSGYGPWPAVEEWCMSGTRS